MEGIKILVKNNIAKVTERPSKITAGTVGLPVEFTFDGAWDGLSKTAVFKAGCKEVIVDSLEASTIVPWEVLLEPHFRLCIGVYGVNADGTEAIPTIWANAGPIHCGANPDGDPAADPTLPVWQKLLNAVGNLLGLKTKARGNLVEAVNEVYDIAYAGGIEADATLTMSGKAADAKATGDAIKDHLEDTENPHGVTYGQAGAAPEGLVMEHFAVDSEFPLVNYMEDQRKKTAIGTVRHFTFDHILSANLAEVNRGVWVCTMFRGIDGGAEIEIRHCPQGIIMRNTYDDYGGWGGWDYVNPPMQAGVEYRTTERHLGSAVYTKLVSVGTVTGTMDNITYVDEEVIPIRFTAHCSDCVFPNQYVSVEVDTQNVHLECPTNLRYLDGYVQVWYIKN